MYSEPIAVSESAKKYIQNLCATEQKSGLRLEVIGGGCAGFSYDYSFVDDGPIDSNDVVVDLDDYKFVVDGTSLMYVIGTIVDYEKKIGQSGLVIKNPNAVSSCGCGESFSV